MKMSKRVLALSLALALILGMIPNVAQVKANAAEEAAAAPVVVWEDSFEVGETFEYVEAQNVPTTSDEDAHWNNAAPKVEDDFLKLDHVSGGNVYVTGGVGGAYDGESCIKLDGETENSRLYLNYNVTNAINAGKFSLVDGKKYVASVWVKFDETSNLTFQLMVKDTADETNPKENLGSKVAKAGEWKQIFLPFTYKAHTEKLYCQIDMEMLAVTQGAVYVDKLQILEAQDATGIALDKSAAEVKVGASVQLTAGLNPAAATDKVVYTWESANNAIAAVDQNGLVTGAAIGTTTIKVTATKYAFNYTSDVRAWEATDVLWTAECAVTVAPASVDAPVVVWEDNFEIGETFETVATQNVPTTSNADAHWNNAAPIYDYDFFQLDWQKSPGEPVTVTGGVGDAYDGDSCVKLDAGTGAGRLYLTYNANIGLDRGKIALAEGEDYVASVWIKFEPGTNMTFELMVKGTAAASNPKTNLGTKNVTAGEWRQIFLPFTFTSEKNLQIVMEMLAVTNGAVCVDKLQILKAEEATGIVLDKTAVELASRESLQLTASLNPIVATNRVDYTWASSDTTVATVDQKGNVTGISTGTATITATAQIWEYDFTGRTWVKTEKTWTANCTVNVVAKAPVIVFEDSFEIGETFSVEAATNQDIIKDNDDNWYGAAPTNKAVFYADLYNTAPSAKATGGVSGAFDGDSCIKLEAPEGSLLYLVYYLKDVTGENKPVLKNNTMYVLSVWVKYDADSGTRYSQMQIKGTTAAVAGGNTGPRVDGGRNLTEWTKIEVPFLYTDANTSMSINLNMQSATGTGAVYFDLLQITELVEATADFTVSGAEQPLNTGDKVALKPNMTPANASTTITWTSSNPAVATVDANGVVTAVSAGEATITAKAAVKQYDFVNRKYIENKATYTGSCVVTVKCAHAWDNGVINPDATCSAEGVITYTCTACGAAKTEAVAAKGHTPGETVRENETPATCTTRGHYDLVTKCSVCNAEISRKTIAVLATGHSYVEEVIDPTCLVGGYTTYTCSTCQHSYVGNETEALDHVYDSDSDPDCNLCGDIREVAPTMPTDAKLKFMAPAGLSFQDYIGMQVMLKNSVAKNYERFWVEITQVDFEGNVSTTTTTGTPYTTSYTVYEQQILSWSMTESVTMTLYGEKDGVIYMGETFTTSVEALALDKIPDYVADGDMARAKALVDMLNFGSAVQTAYDHNPTDLPNAELGDLSQYGTTGDPEFTAVNDITGKNSITVYSNNISMQSKVEFQFMVKTSALNGKTVVAKMGDKEATVAYEPYSSYTIIRVACGAAYMRENFTIVVNDANGNPVTCTYNVSVEAYASQQLDGAKAPAMLALIRYGDAVAAIG